MFDCDKCGLCCQNIGDSAIYADLDNGEGTCKYFDFDTNLCLIYKSRPLKCCIDKAYEIFYKEIMSKKDYYKRNYEACKKLKNIRRD